MFPEGYTREEALEMYQRANREPMFGMSEEFRSFSKQSDQLIRDRNSPLESKPAPNNAIDRMNTEGMELSVGNTHTGLYSNTILSDLKEKGESGLLKKAQEPFQSPEVRNKGVVNKSKYKRPVATAPVDIGSVADTVDQAIGVDTPAAMLELAGVKTAGERTKETVTGVTAGQEKAIGLGSGLMAGAALFIGVTSVMDTAIKAKRNKEARTQVKKQEKKIRVEEKRGLAVRKKISRRESNTRVNVKNEVFSMFEQAIGHHKMGNSRF